MSQGKARVGARVSSVDVARFVDRNDGGKRYHNGVDITNITWYYGFSEQKKLSKKLQSHIREEKEWFGVNKKKPSKCNQQNK
eukprot:7001074-Ditylum_brightwellii.AAC.1